MPPYRIFMKFIKINRIAYDHRKCFSQTSQLCSFFERDRKGFDTPQVVDIKWDEFFKLSRKGFVQECKKLWEETKDHFHQDRKLYMHGDTDVFWRFDSEDCLKNWRITSDKEHKGGNSECSLIINDKKKAVFSGTVDLTLPKDGKQRYAGYCGIKSKRKQKSFYRDDYYHFSSFTHLELRVRGDGRNYLVNLGIGMYYDVNWFNTYTYALFTHGGPYWQVVRIPFSKFFLTSKGRTQDLQRYIPLDRIDSVGITSAAVGGPFKLEIDYIGCHIDWRHNEVSAYEMYKIPQEFVSS